jgi:hypothetical protein
MTIQCSIVCVCVINNGYSHTHTLTGWANQEDFMVLSGRCSACCSKGWVRHQEANQRAATCLGEIGG